MKKGFIGLVFLWVTQICCAQFSLRSDQPIKLACDNAEEKVVQTALKLLCVIINRYFLHLPP